MTNDILIASIGIRIIIHYYWHIKAAIGMEFGSEIKQTKRNIPSVSEQTQ